MEMIEKGEEEDIVEMMIGSDRLHLPSSPNQTKHAQTRSQPTMHRNGSIHTTHGKAISLPALTMVAWDTCLILEEDLSVGVFQAIFGSNYTRFSASDGT